MRPSAKREESKNAMDAGCGARLWRTCNVGGADILVCHESASGGILATRADSNPFGRDKNVPPLTDSLVDKNVRPIDFGHKEKVTPLSAANTSADTAGAERFSHQERRPALAPRNSPSAWIEM